MTRLFSELAFHPSINEIVPPTSQGALVILSGTNNCGKSAYLKKAISDPKKLYIGVNRFYSFHYMTLYTENTHEINQWYQSMEQQASTQQHHNFEGSFFSCANAVARLSNARRSQLFEVFEDLFGIPISVQPEDPENDFSNKFISVDGDSLSVTSSGTRLFLGLLAALMDERFATVAIDEPELGLSPTLQRRLAGIVIRGQAKDVLFPHNPNIVLTTHSHLFLDRQVPRNNWVVSRTGNLISAEQCKSFSELHDIQFRLLGNDLSELFLPDVVVFVEGETDKLFLERVINLHFPQTKAVIQACGGDIATRLAYWSESLGDMQLSPYRERTFVIYDKVKQAGIERSCAKAGLAADNKIEWKDNGIEFLYPGSIMGQIFRKDDYSPADLRIEGDQVSVGDIYYRKMELSRKVTELLRQDTALPEEIHSKFLRPMSSIGKG